MITFWHVYFEIHDEVQSKNDKVHNSFIKYFPAFQAFLKLYEIGNCKNIF